MKLLLIGNHTCGNRGDAAILRGLMAELRLQHPDVMIDAYSRYPVSSSYILDETLTVDPIEQYHDSATSFIDKVYKRFSRRFLGYYLARKLKKEDFVNLPKHILKQINVMHNYDAIIQVGGSNFVDLYGPAKFESALCALLAKKKLFLIGHSVGPFNSKRYAKLASTVFSRVEVLALREELSHGLMKKSNVADIKVTKGADTAWIVPNTPITLFPHLAKLLENKPVIAITLRELAPFDRQLGVTQAQYEERFADLINALIQEGYRVVICSTGTGIDSYWRDDRMIALKVQALTQNPECHVIMDELNDVQIGSFLSHCILTIGTRLHSAIISMNFGTPAIAINYEHKSKGIMAQLEMPELSKDISTLFDGNLLTSAKEVLNNIEQVKVKMNVQVEHERQKVRMMVQNTLNNISGKK
ncbi:colanic acid biosynthesis pyruvyl transferase WcaK [Pseudoalteromonas sp. S327]|uniref:colanic acid biosynthesis pyruvyl transferase WcaK n=1 Tax=unclassified Pseudoalteromonas TaxID=194690 RepID=UPI00110AC4C2|nr:MULTISPECIES: colanic acid biosynthesis pyruvyl transferase WcaK [unclassified Pseudoalteromonas]MCK8095601.1 colanic acid biosynthesis pyruvyl transferase WcaK [Pseudoalteromonas sp. 1CM17D]TMO06484.1 colanic acid biosynthesis pyruvyl transferase WcaK [Pseudoalteromonas sp. S327]TMO19813.1 colanic acid biosynthesis pyruvyl transferase WcaK [Pseudoalteromonas sp. S326]